MRSDIQYLTQIREQLTESKWGKGSETYLDDHMCLGQAIERVVHNQPYLADEQFVERMNAVDRLNGVVARQIRDRSLQYRSILPGDLATIIAFNDHASTTLADVHAVLDASIAALATVE